MDYDCRMTNQATPGDGLDHHGVPGPRSARQSDPAAAPFALTKLRLKFNSCSCSRFAKASAPVSVISL
jgi:hypothetical protein